MKINVKLINMRNWFKRIVLTLIAVLNCGFSFAQTDLPLSANGKKGFQMLVNIREDIASSQQELQEIKTKLSKSKGVVSSKEKIALADRILKMDSMENESIMTTIKILEDLDEAALAELEKNIPLKITELTKSFDQDLQKKLSETPKAGTESFAFDPAFGRKNRSEVQALSILMGSIPTAKIKIKSPAAKMSTPNK